MRNRATRTDVARLAGVSTATVSNVMRGAGSVREETARRVREAAQRLRYSPDMIARSMSTSKTMQIGILLEDVKNPYYGEIVSEFESAAAERGYFVNVCAGLHKTESYFENFIARRVDGVFVTALPYKFDTEKLYGLLDYDISLVVSGNVDADCRRVSSIEHDYPGAMHEAIAYLRSLGHRDIAYLSGLGRELMCDMRCLSYRREMGEAGLELMIDGKYPYSTNIQAGYASAVRLMESGARFTAAICGNDLMAMGAMRAFGERGLRVPEDVSVMGFDGIEIGEYFTPSLTTMRVDMKAFGRKAFELLLSGMEGCGTATYTNRLELVERESVCGRGLLTRGEY